MEIVEAFYVKVEGGKVDGTIRHETTIGPFDSYETATQEGDNVLRAMGEADGYQIEKYRVKMESPEPEKSLLVP